MKHRKQMMKFRGGLQGLLARGAIQCEEDPNAGGGGGGEANWRDSLPDDIKADPGLADFADVGAMAQSFLKTKSMVGNSIRVPGEDAGDEDKASFNEKLLTAAPGLMSKPDFDNAEQSVAFYRSIGMPEEAKGYEIPTQEGVSHPEGYGDMFKGAAHKAGLSNKQFQAIMSTAIQSEVESAEAATAAHTEAMKGLKGEWGMAFEDNISKAAIIAQKTGAPAGLIATITEGKANPDTLKWLHGLSGKFGGEGNEIFNQGDTNTAKMTPLEASERRNEIMNNKQHPYWNATDPGHKAAIDKIVELNRMANAN